MPEESEPRPAADRGVDGEPVVAGPAGVPQAPVDPWPAGEPADAADTAVGAPPVGEAPVGEAPAGGAPAGGAPTPRWSARASVPASRDAEETGSQWVFDPGRGVMLPALIAVMILLLLGLLALGIWLIVRDNGGPNPTPTSTISAGPTSSAPATTGPATNPVTTPLAPVVLEDYRGRPADEVMAALTTLGLAPQRVDQSSTEIEAGKVIGTEPGPGTPVARGTTVKVIVSTGAPTEPPTTPPTTPPPTA
jgi:serine/threonine-protein kinase